MRTKQFKINGVNRTGVLLAGIPGLVKIYTIDDYDKPWIVIKNKAFTVQDELDKLVMDFITLKYQPDDKKEQIEKDFRNLCEIYARGES